MQRKGRVNWYLDTFELIHNKIIYHLDDTGVLKSSSRRFPIIPFTLSYGVDEK